MFLLRDLLRVLPPNSQSLCLALVPGVVFLRRVDVSAQWICMLAVRDHSCWYVWTPEFRPTYLGSVLFILCLMSVLASVIYGVRSRRTHSLEDQLDRADAGSWQIADGSDTGS